MGRKSDLRAEIGRLRGRISEYQRNISDLLSRSERIRADYHEIDFTNRRESIHDSAGSGAWTGQLNDEMQQRQAVMVQNTSGRLNEVVSLQQDIQNAVNKLRHMIDECNAQISNLEAIIASLD
ncbi:MAG: hypothetical protein IJS76_06150 [Pseudobutyrivibrio sp.]|nr:hypothetical protein [Pseudobutyrivibrio sp.]